MCLKITEMKIVEDIFYSLLLNVYDFFILDCHKLYLLSHVPDNSTLEREDGFYSLKQGIGIILHPKCISLSIPSCVSLRYKRHGPLPQDILLLIPLLIPRSKYNTVYLIRDHIFAIMIQ